MDSPRTGARSYFHIFVRPMNWEHKIPVKFLTSKNDASVGVTLTGKLKMNKLFDKQNTTRFSRPVETTGTVDPFLKHPPNGCVGWTKMTSTNSDHHHDFRAHHFQGADKPRAPTTWFTSYRRGSRNLCGAWRIYIKQGGVRKVRYTPEVKKWLT